MKRNIFILLLIICMFLVGCAPKADETEFGVTVNGVLESTKAEEPTSKPKLPAQNGGNNETTDNGKDTPDTPVQSPDNTTENQNETTPSNGIELKPNQSSSSSSLEESVAISCMTFNVLSNIDNINFLSPQDRAKMIVPFLLETDADIVGLQEVDTQIDFQWRDYIVRNTASVYAARSIDQETEFGNNKMFITNGLVILYRKDRFVLKDSGCAQYSGDKNRWYQYVLLEDKESGKEVVVTNTHLSILSSGNATDGDLLRTHEAKELKAFWDEYVGDRALFATGDYNAERNTTPHVRVLRTGKFDFSLELAMESDDTAWLDFIYVNPECMQINKYDCMSNVYLHNGQKITMSDHYPVMTYAEFK